jgi:alanyl-tRNA synthetase
MGRAEAEELGAMALFGEKYGEWVRVVEVAEVSRELCGGTHVANTAEVGIFKITSEGSSAANVRRVEAITGPAGIDWFRDRAEDLRAAGEALGSPQDPVGGAQRASERLQELSKGAEKAQREALGDTAKDLAASAEDVGGVKVLAARAPVADNKALLEMANRIGSSLGDSAVALGGADGGKVGLVVLVSKDAVGRGLDASAIVREAASVVGGGGGGRPDMAQAGGRDPERLDEALDAARSAIVSALA